MSTGAQGLCLFLIQVRKEGLDNSFTTHQIWKRNRYVFNARDICHRCADSEDGALTLYDHFHDSSNGAANAIICCPLALNDMISGSSDLFIYHCIILWAN